jgi:uncharacterized protein YbaP (TraB family)
MKRLFVFAAFAALVPPLAAQSSVWKVTRGESTLYLGGTCHVLRPTDFPLPPEYQQAFAASAALYFETDLKRVLSPEMQQAMMPHAFYQDGRTLEQALTPEAWRAVDDYIAKNQLPRERIAIMKPWFFAVMLAGIELQKLGVTQEGVDVHLFREALQAGKPVAGLEPFERHVAFITGMADGHESELLLNAINDLANAPKEFPELLAGWRQGDLATIERIMVRDMREKYPALHRTLIVQRNESWLPVVERLLGTPEVEFVLAGAGHFAGPEGLLELLRARGCTIEQVKAAQK